MQVEACEGLLQPVAARVGEHRIARIDEERADLASARRGDLFRQGATGGDVEDQGQIADARAFRAIGEMIDGRGRHRTLADDPAAGLAQPPGDDVERLDQQIGERGE